MQQNKNLKGKSRAGRASDDAWGKYSFFLEKESGIKLTVSGTGKSEPFAAMDYGNELKVKGRALSAFLQDAGMSARPGEIIPSPMPRHYRTTTKRRAKFSSNRLVLSADESAAGFPLF